MATNGSSEGIQSSIRNKTNDSNNTDINRTQQTIQITTTRIGIVTVTAVIGATTMEEVASKSFAE